MVDMLIEYGSRGANGFTTIETIRRKPTRDENSVPKNVATLYGSFTTTLFIESGECSSKK
jgi:hypothetical protein